MNKSDSKSILILTGMHRSGTSLTASLLQSSGIDIGSQLMGPEESNIYGHFEDLDFVAFHEQVLYSEGLSRDGWSLERGIQVQEQFMATAKSIIENRRSKPVWGWKDPRTTLFLDFWKELIPQAKFLFVFRSPWDIVDSLYRRGDVIFKKNPNLALAIWINYNQAILDFHDSHSNDCIILNVNQIVSDSNILNMTVSQKLGIPLGSLEPLFNNSLLHQIHSSHRPRLVEKYFPEAINLYQQMNKRAEVEGYKMSQFNSDTAAHNSYKVWALQDWMEVRSLESKLKSSEAKLEGVKSKLGNADSQLQLAHKENEHLRLQLPQLEAKLKDSQIKSDSQLDLMQNRLKDLEGQLSEAVLESDLQIKEAQRQLNETKDQISNMEKSRFWKLRRVWILVKEVLLPNRTG